MHEELAIGAYVKAMDIEFTVTTEKNVQKVELIDKLVQVKKTDLVTGEELDGAKLIVTDENENIIDEWISNSKEPHFVKSLEEGKTYKLTEITSPYAYEIAESIYFTVTEDKQTQVIEMKDMPILKNIKVIKIDKDTKEVIKEKFKFGIYADEECTQLIKEVESDIETGTVLFEELRYNTYFIKELQSPKAYKLSDKVVKVEINDKGVFADNIELEEQDEVYSFEFENEKIDTPKTRRF